MGTEGPKQTPMTKAGYTKGWQGLEGRPCTQPEFNRARERVCAEGHHVLKAATREVRC